jgi:hypothetical protein
MLFRIVCLVTCCISSVAVAQEIHTIPESLTRKDSLRAYYIQQFHDYFFIYPTLKQRSLNFELEKEDEERVLAFKPNNSYSLGLGMYLFEIGFELAFAVPLEEKSISRYGESTARDVQLNVLGKSWGVDTYYQKYQGFYVTDSDTEVADDSPYPKRSDIASRNLGLTGTYVFNNRKFSFRSAYNFAERQLFSKGSVLMSASISSFRLKADSSIVTDEQILTFGEGAAFSEIRYTSLSIAPGYTYSIVFNNFFLNGSLSLGPAHHWIKFRNDGGTDEFENTINSFAAARIAIGYNGQRIFGGVSFVTQGSNVKFQDVRFSNNNGSFKILIGYRFNEYGILKRRVWDVLPIKI